MASSKYYAIIAGVGAGTGRSVALKFAKTYPVVLLSRSPSSYESIVEEINKSGGSAHGFSADTSSSTAMTDTFAKIKNAIGDAKLAAAVYNVGGKLVRKPFLELSAEEFAAGYNANGLGLFNFAQQAMPLLLQTVASKPEHSPTLILTGATASLKASANFAAFATGKFAMRAIGQTLAREFGPQGVHVAHVIFDGVVDIPSSKNFQVNDGKPDGKINSDAIAENYWNLHTQHRSAWTQELDLRPYVEKF
ncbi:hypothetical protein ONS95_004872 [Cadophora gregata]|uniref:uncharacterized protein n=1 Tax=Cadophora gregata TaxID=51156 RepID=UPI0026DB3CEB|nr:uncharacterized protein ONS95_004872 [Cadophora gregata]KAK0104586.1 hypothetical protein ONS95_004872 [Cadophora gregata]KAK0115326.1 hypothetical protein ONS96_013785 [Cadophora gregata f. sp. sojae]